ncbi:MAG: hypothetical protein C7B46_00650 [Sulfobacillus benefaciens]|uniref:Translation initiation factor 2 n=1 Tax=Sulfobacillus benefaciens TaxID=453960 RepID=A0A2T2XM08_9FIRM|nr:MAG: hypothetical protein C7B46_00650 [Sulfobacillus benefaciens]
MHPRRQEQSEAKTSPLQLRVEELQQRITELRVSRRILMDLLTAESQKSQSRLQQLELENRRLRRLLKRQSTRAGKDRGPFSSWRSS